ncbi:Hypothetical predicted protein, partial [Pelobates cultripes]
MGSKYELAPLTLWSNNVRGLNVPEKRTQILHALSAERVSVAFLQETHLKGADPPSLKN